ncbi:polysaccharide deacetylase [Thalassospira xiamenensis]|nr:polysaccharide deacetylase [Thalassospira xiamenensis]
MRLTIPIVTAFGLIVSAFLVSVMGTNSASANGLPKGVVILQYHHVSADTPRVTSITADELREHLQYLQDNNFNVISLPEAAAGMQDGESLPDKSVVITFDDGWDNIYEQGVPVLREFDMPYTIFVNPALMEETPRLYMTWAQLREVAEEGATIANHSDSHDHLTWRQDGESERDWRQRMMNDIEGAQQKLEEEMGAKQPRYFAYPYGEYNPALEEILTDLGYLGFAQHSGPWGTHSPLTAIPRFPAAGNYANLNTLKAKLASLPLPVVAVSDNQMVRANHDTTPELKAEVASTDDFYRASFQCFIGGEVVKPTWEGTTFSVSAQQPIPVGRSRYNCTVPSIAGEGRYYWYSQPWVREDENGRWPD